MELRRGVQEIRAEGERRQRWMVACAKDEVATLLARQDAGLIRWPAKPKTPGDVLKLACYLNECRRRRDWHLFDAAALAERIRFLSRFLKHGDPLVKLAEQASQSP